MYLCGWIRQLVAQFWSAPLVLPLTPELFTGPSQMPTELNWPQTLLRRENEFSKCAVLAPKVSACLNATITVTITSRGLFLH